MKFVSGLMMAGALALTATAAQAGAIAPNATPITFDDGLGSNLTVSGTLSGLAYYQTNSTHAFPGDHSTYLDLDNAMVSIAKTAALPMNSTMSMRRRAMIDW